MKDLNPPSNKKSSGSQSPRDWKKYYAKRRNRLFKVCVLIRKQIRAAGLFKQFPFEGNDVSIGQRLAALLFKYESRASYLEAEDFLRRHPREKQALGLSRALDSNMIWRANQLLKKPLREKLFDSFFEEKKPCDTAMDSTGHSQNRFARWLYDKKKKCKDFIKSHVLSQTAGSKLVVALSFSNGAMNDQKRGLYLVRTSKRRVQLQKTAGDRGYPNRKLCQAIDDAGGTPFLHPKSNFGVLSKGYPAFRRMMLSFKEDEEAWLQTYHKRSTIEGLFSWLKRKFGSALVGTRYACQKAELASKFFLYNVHATLFF